mgnify:CR=1 FL=1
MIGTNIAIDFGSSSTELYVQGKGVILDEPTMIAVDVETGMPIAIGNAAYTINGRTDDSIEVISPIVGGIISNYTMAEHILKYYLQKILKTALWRKEKIRQQQRQSKLENRRQEVARKRSEMGLLQRNESKKDAEIEKPNKESKMHNVKPDISQRDALRRNNIEPAERRKREAAKQTDVRSDTKKVKDAHLLGTANFEARTKKEMDEFSTNKERKDKRKKSA